MGQLMKEQLLNLLKCIKRAMPLRLLFYLQPLREALHKIFYGPQLTMVLPNDVQIPTMQLEEGYIIKTFREYCDRDAWVSVVNGILGDWDRKTADVFFFGDKYFDPDLCLLLLHNGQAIGTASGRVRIIGGRMMGEVHMVSVLPTYRGKGLGNLLMVTVIEMLRKRNNSEVVLKTDNWRHAAVKTYTKLGFKMVN